METTGEWSGCFVRGCVSSLHEGEKPVLFPFPRDGKLCVRWWGATGSAVRAGEGPGRGGVCARHFAPEQYRAGSGELREDAVPALHLPPRGLQAEEAALGVYTPHVLQLLARHTARRPVLLLQPAPWAGHPAHAAHTTALADLAAELGAPPRATQARLTNYINGIYERLWSWCRMRAKYELGSEERAGEVAPEWLRRAEEARAGGRGPAAALWRALAARARALRTLDMRPHLPGELGDVWEKGVELARARLELLTRLGDDEGALHPGARPTFDMEDLVVLLAPEDGGGPGGDGAAPGLALTLLFGLVQKYRLEEAEGEAEGAARARRWTLATREYRSRHRAASVLLLQRRWHRLKQCALRAPSRPPLHAALLRRFPHLHGRPPLPWEQLVAAEHVVEHETPCSPTDDCEPFEDVAMRFQEPSSDDDVILIEKHIDTYEISDDDEDEDEHQEKLGAGGGGGGDDYIHDTTATTATATAASSDGDDQIDVKLTLSPVVVVRDVTSLPGWAVRAGRYVDLRRLVPLPPRRTIANTIVFEEDEDEEPKLAISLSEEVRERADRGEQGETMVLRKRVQLPDIEQVRKQNRNMLTAEVLPCPAGTAGTGAAPPPPPTPPTPATPPTTSRASRYCCWALRARAVTAARARHARSSGRLHRPLDNSVDLHRSHCKESCECCCAGAEWGAAGAALAAEQRALDDRLLRLLPALEAPPLPSPAPPRPAPAARPAPATRPAPRPRGGRKRRAASPPPPPPPPPPDDLQEWIRQKNLTARFFDLNLKRPAPGADANRAVFKYTNTILLENLRPPPPAPPPPAPPPAVTVVPTPAAPPPQLPPVKVVSTPDKAPPPSLETMSVSEDEDEAGGPRPDRPDRPDKLLGMKIVAMKRNPTTGQNMIVVQPATATTPAGHATTARPDCTLRPIRLRTSRPNSFAWKLTDKGNKHPGAERGTAASTDRDGAAGRSMNAAPLTVTAAPGNVTAQRDAADEHLVFHAVPAVFEDTTFQDTEITWSEQVSWAGRPLVISCYRLQAPWAPLLGWYMLTEQAVLGEGADVEYWAFGRDTMYRLASLPAAAGGTCGVRLVHGVPDAGTCRTLAVRLEPLLALHVASRRVLRVLPRRHGNRLVLQASATHLAERLAEALNAEAEEDDET